MLAFVIISLFVAIFAVIFALQNTAPATIRFFTWRSESSLALVLLLAVAAGALMSFFAALPTLLRLKWHLRTHKRRLAALEAAGEKSKTAPGAGR
jgi:putative membrane protein